MKSKIFKSILFVCIVTAIYFYYINTRPPFQILSGETMNTYYRITIRSNQEDTLLHNEIKNELQQINNEMSVFEKTSDLSQFNKNKENGWIDVPETLTDILKTSYNVYMHTNGYFDPSVGKIIDAWGFGKSKNIKIPTEEEIDIIKKDTGFNQIKFSRDFRRASKKNKDKHFLLVIIL